MSRRKKANPLGAFFFLLGCLTVLGATFLLGVFTGRSWDRLPFVRKATADAASPAGPGPAGAPKPRGRADKAEPAPDPSQTLTFYQELTAPLGPTVAPPPARPRREAAKREEPPKREEQPAKRDEPAGRDEPAAGEEPPKREEAPRGNFTVQVAAYRERAPAETLRATLAAAGHDAYVAEAQAEGGVRYRVRVGAFPTRETAQEAVARLGGEGRSAAYVTLR